MGFSEARLQDSKGRKFTGVDVDPYVAAAAEYKRGVYILDDIQPSFTVESLFVFDVAADATGYVLVR